MLLVHQAGSVKVGEVVRYTLTYSPYDDPILPSPSRLHLRIKNTSAIPLRAAYLRGPYTIHVSAYPQVFNPDAQLKDPEQNGYPQFEPNLKAGGHWHAHLTIPEKLRQSGTLHGTKDSHDTGDASVVWIIEISSQILFSATASVHYELLVARDARSLDIGFAAIASHGHGEPGQVNDLQEPELRQKPRGVPPKGIYSRAVKVLAEDTKSLWNKPPLPSWPSTETTLTIDPNNDKIAVENSNELNLSSTQSHPTRQPQKLHLVVLTHGLHSNLGADMLYLKERIDASGAKSQQRPASQKQQETHDRSKTSNKSEDPEDQELIIVRGFPGNAVRTERGIQYLGKRLAKWLLEFTYPDQPYMPPQKSAPRSMSSPFGRGSRKNSSTFQRQKKGFQYDTDPNRAANLPYTFSKISFVGHSLGGLVQLYAIAYIQKHCPHFFDSIQPENFVTLAAPLLGLSNENPMYVKFALDFGLVGRTGQDLGLTWRPPTIARSGWSAMIAGLGSSGTEEHPKREDPRSKPLLRILPSGPAHYVLNMFRNRTVYSNVVNDGIVPLRTSCLLFLDWRGLDRVENARRENGLIGTMASFGWAELTGANSISRNPETGYTNISDSNSDAELENNEAERSSRSIRRFAFKPRFPSSSSSPRPSRILEDHFKDAEAENISIESSNSLDTSKQLSSNNGLSDLFSFFKPNQSRKRVVKTYKPSTKTERTYKRAQTIDSQGMGDDKNQSGSRESGIAENSHEAQHGSLAGQNSNNPPPKTSIFESAGDILNPPIPTSTWLVDPSSRHRTIFHDRIYYPEDIPAPRVQRSRLGRSFSSEGTLTSQNSSVKSKEPVASNGNGIRVEEKIARAYHRDLSWRKVLVRLEPDAHNNMIVRRMFANAHGWDVVKHLCDTHFDSSSAMDIHEKRKPLIDEPEVITESPVGIAEEGLGQSSIPLPKAQRTTSELRESKDEVADLETSSIAHVHRPDSLGSKSRLSNSSTGSVLRNDSVEWNDEIFEGSDDEADTEDEGTGPFEAWQKFWSPSPRHGRRHSDVSYRKHSGLSDTQLVHDHSVHQRTEQRTNNDTTWQANEIAEPWLVKAPNQSPNAPKSDRHRKNTTNNDDSDRSVERREKTANTTFDGKQAPPALMRQKSLTEEVAKLSVSGRNKPSNQ